MVVHRIVVVHRTCAAAAAHFHPKEWEEVTLVVVPLQVVLSPCRLLASARRGHAHCLPRLTGERGVVIPPRCLLPWLEIVGMESSDTPRRRRGPVICLQVKPVQATQQEQLLHVEDARASDVIVVRRRRRRRRRKQHPLTTLLRRRKKVTQKKSPTTSSTAKTATNTSTSSGTKATTMTACRPKRKAAAIQTS